MTILSSKIILQRMLEGLEEYDFDRLKEEFSPENPKIDNEGLAKKIINSEEEKRRKFFENFKLDQEKIREEAKKYKYLDFSDKQKMVKEKKLFPIMLDSLDIGKVRPANIDLRLGDQYFVSREKHPKKLEKGSFLVIEPGDFAILTTYEYMYVPEDLLGLISLRYKYKKSGLINISGFHVDPGYVGRLLFSVYNSGPKSVVLTYKEPVFMIMYDELKESVFKGYGEGYENITVDVVSELIGYSISPIHLEKRIKSLEAQTKLLYGLLAGILIAIFAKLLG